MKRNPRRWIAAILALLVLIALAIALSVTQVAKHNRKVAAANADLVTTVEWINGVPVTVTFHSKSYSDGVLPAPTKEIKPEALITAANTPQGKNKPAINSVAAGFAGLKGLPTGGKGKKLDPSPAQVDVKSPPKQTPNASPHNGGGQQTSKDKTQTKAAPNSGNGKPGRSPGAQPDKTPDSQPTSTKSSKGSGTQNGGGKAPSPGSGGKSPSLGPGTGGKNPSSPGSGSGKSPGSGNGKPGNQNGHQSVKSAESQLISVIMHQSTKPTKKPKTSTSQDKSTGKPKGKPTGKPTGKPKGKPKGGSPPPGNGSHSKAEDAIKHAMQQAGHKQNRH